MVKPPNVELTMPEKYHQIPYVLSLRQPEAAKQLHVDLLSQLLGANKDMDDFKDSPGYPTG